MSILQLCHLWMNPEVNRNPEIVNTIVHAKLYDPESTIKQIPAIKNAMYPIIVIMYALLILMMYVPIENHSFISIIVKRTAANA